MNCSNCESESSSRSVPITLVGWVSESGGHGTLSLVLTCLATIFLCTWVVIHPRIYRSELRATCHKLVLFFKTILAPELIAIEGLQDWAQCRRMERECGRLTDGNFKLIHLFYVSMLGLRYRTPLGDRVIWPNQYPWLRRQRLITWEDHDQAGWAFSEDTIRDKSKGGFRNQDPGPATSVVLEATTLGYIPMFVVTYFFWWAKPKDIRSPSIIDLPVMASEQRRTSDAVAVSNKFDNEGMERRRKTRLWKPLARKLSRHTSQREASYFGDRDDTAKLDFFHTNTFAIQHELRQETVLAHWDPRLYRSKIWPLTVLFGISFPALHLVCWDTAFPTDVEMWLWRGSAFVSIVSMLVFMHFEKVVHRWDGIVTLVSIAAPVLYLASRVFMMVEVFVALRAEDSAVYDTFDVSIYCAHLL